MWLSRLRSRYQWLEFSTDALACRFEAFIFDCGVSVRDMSGIKVVSSYKTLRQNVIENIAIALEDFIVAEFNNFPSIRCGGHNIVP